MAIQRIYANVTWADRGVLVGFAYDLDDADPEVAALLTQGYLTYCPTCPLNTPIPIWQLFTVGTPAPPPPDPPPDVRTTTIDFGTTPVDEKQFTIVDADATAGLAVIATQSGEAASGRTADENEMTALVISAVAGTGSVTLNVTAVNGPAVGLYTINYYFVPA